MKELTDTVLNSLVDELETSFFLDSSQGNWQSPILAVQDKRVAGDLRVFEPYRQEIMKIPPLSEQAVRELAAVVWKEKPKAGCEPSFNFVFARNELVEHSLKQGLWFSEKYWLGTKGIINIKDIITECNQGLVTAAENFDATKGVKFSTFVFKCLLNSVHRAFADNLYAGRQDEPIRNRSDFMPEMGRGAVYG